jgi:hypothetical protein
MSTWDGPVYLGVREYTPYGLSPNTDVVDTVVAGTSPWGYWKLNDASGAPQDSSGNARHGTVALGTPVYSQAALTTKVGNSIALDGTARLQFPSPANLGHVDSLTCMAALVLLTGTGNDGDGNSPWRVFMGGGSSNTGFAQAFFDTTANGGWSIDSPWAALEAVNHPYYGGDTGPNTHTYPTTQVRFIVLNAVYSSMEFWVNGLLTSYWNRDQSLGGTPDLFVGQDPNTFWGTPAARYSNVMSWDHNLTHAQIKTLTEAVLDTSAFAASWRPQT